MSTTLSNGYKNPETGDRGSSFFPDLNFDIARVNSHKHDGEDSEQINIKDIQKTTQVISADDWEADSGGGTYSQTVTLPVGITFDETIINLIVSGGDYDGMIVHPTVVKATSGSYVVIINDDTQTLRATYG